jgi:hypothetical protein
MKKGLRLWFYPEAMLGTITGVLLVVTLFSRDWIEAVFRVDPDQGSGALEWGIVAGLLVVTLAMTLLARYEWRRASVVAA